MKIGTDVKTGKVKNKDARLFKIIHKYNLLPLKFQYNYYKTCQVNFQLHPVKLICKISLDKFEKPEQEIDLTLLSIKLHCNK